MGRELPFIQFYVGDWMSEPNLRMVSHEAKGVWIDVLCLMWVSPERGKLLRSNGSPYTINQLARTIGWIGGVTGTNEICNACCNAPVTLSEIMSELAECQVCDYEESIYISRRMTREEKKRSLTNRRVQKHRNKVKRPCNTQSNTPCNTKVTLLETETETETETERERESTKEAPLTALNFDAVFSAKKVSIVEAAKLVQKCHEDFQPVPEIQIVNSLKSWPQERWREAIETMSRHYAGARLARPCGTLENYLAGKGKGSGKQKSKNQLAFEAYQAEVMSKTNKETCNAAN